MSYDLVLGYSGILSFGHAAFFGGGAYAMAIFYKHVVPGWLADGKFHISDWQSGPDPAVVFMIALLMVCVVVILIGLLFTVVSVRVKGCLLCHDHPGHGQCPVSSSQRPRIL